MVLAFAHWVAFAVKYCWVPYKPVGSRLASVTFLYWFAAEATVGAVDEGVGAGAGAAGFVALGEGLALGFGAAVVVTGTAATIVDVVTLGLTTDAVPTLVTSRLPALESPCAVLGTALKPPYVAAAAVPTGVTTAAVTTAATVTGFALALRCAPMNFC